MKNKHVTSTHCTSNCVVLMRYREDMAYNYPEESSLPLEPKVW